MLRARTVTMSAITDRWVSQSQNSVVPSFNDCGGPSGQPNTIENIMPNKDNGFKHVSVLISDFYIYLYRISTCVQLTSTKHNVVWKKSFLAHLQLIHTRANPQSAVSLDKVKKSYKRVCGHPAPQNYANSKQNVCLTVTHAVRSSKAEEWELDSSFSLYIPKQKDIHMGPSEPDKKCS